MKQIRLAASMLDKFVNFGEIQKSEGVFHDGTNITAANCQAFEDPGSRFNLRCQPPPPHQSLRTISLGTACSLPLLLATLGRFMCAISEMEQKRNKNRSSRNLHMKPSKIGLKVAVLAASLPRQACFQNCDLPLLIYLAAFSATDFIYFSRPSQGPF